GDFCGIGKPRSIQVVRTRTILCILPMQSRCLCVMSKPATPTTRDRRDADASVTYGFGPLSISEPDRVRPGKEFIERMRTTFPIEREMDKMLTRKMEHRAAPAYAGASLERMTEHLTAFLNEAVEGPYRIT